MRGLLLSLVISFGGTAAFAADWTPMLSDGRVNFSAQSRINQATLSGACNKLLGPGISFTLYDYTDGALQTVDDASEPIVLDLVTKGQRQQSKVSMHYFAPERAWVLSGRLPMQYVDALARADSMTISNVQGVAVAQFDLTGTAKLRAAMRATCGF